MSAIQVRQKGIMEAEQFLLGQEPYPVGVEAVWVSPFDDSIVLSPATHKPAQDANLAFGVMTLSGYVAIEHGDWLTTTASGIKRVWRPSVFHAIFELAPTHPTVVCLCGSTRFWREFQRASLTETLAGRIVLSIGAASGTDDEHFGNLPRAEYDRVKTMLDELHLRKIDMADEVLILNVGGYMGESTRRELAYAQAQGKRIRFLEAPSDGSK